MQIIISILIVLGGVGFIVIKEVKSNVFEKRQLKGFSLHSKIVLSVTAFLIVFGGVMIFFSEFLHAIDKYTLWEKIELSLFHSITLRTAGFNSIPMNDFSAHTLYLMTLFMFIGASPGSTGGGIKTTTFAILVQSVRATMRGRPNVEFFNRVIPQQLVVKAISIVMISLVIITGFIYTLMSIETTHSFITLMFEAISAFATVGLSLGVTAYLSVAGKFAIIALMFIGRVGPLTIALALGQREQIGGGHNYPDGRVMIG